MREGGEPGAHYTARRQFNRPEGALPSDSVGLSLLQAAQALPLSSGSVSMPMGFLWWAVETPGES